MDVLDLRWFTGDNQTRFSEEILLGNTNLIIHSDDLSNDLFRWMCRDNNSPVNHGSDMFGPNLVAYAKVVEKFFHLLKECRIKPIIVEVKNLNSIETKRDHREQNERTYIRPESSRRLQKAEKKIEKLANMANQADIDIDTVELSPLIYMTFKQVIKKLAIECRQATENYRFGIINLANELDCPVLAISCDYLMYPMSKGFIRLDLDFFDRQNIVSDDMNKCIRCRLFSHRRLLSALPGLQSESIPFLAVITEIRFVDSESIKRSFYSIWNNNHTRFEDNGYKRNKNLGNYLEWMRGNSRLQLIQKFCGLVHRHGGTNEVQRDLRQELEIAMRHRSHYDIGRPFETFLEWYYMLYNDSVQPAVRYLVNLVKELKLDTFILYIMTTRRVSYDRIYLNDPNQQSTNCIKIRPYSVAMCLLRPTALMGEPVIENPIWLYDRLEVNQYGRREVREARELEGFGSLDHLHINSLVTLPDDDKKSLLLSTFRVNLGLLNGFDLPENPDLIDEIHLCLIMVKYINEESRIGDFGVAPLDRSFVSALILTCLFYTTTSFNQPSPVGLPDEDVLLVRRELGAVAETPIVHGNSEMYLTIVHQMVSIECAIDAFCMLNSLLGQVFPQPRLDVWFNGPLIFQLTRMIETGQVEGLTCLNIPNLMRIVGDLLP